MPRHQAKRLQEAEESAPLLPMAWPEQPALVEFAKDYEPSGKIASKDESTWLAVVQDLLAGQSQRSVAARYHVGRNTIPAVVQILEERGKLKPLKERVSAKLGRVIELCVENSHDLLMDGKVPANVLPIMMGIGIERKRDLDGESSHRIECENVVIVGAADVVAYLTKKGLPVPAIDVESTVSSDINNK